MPAWDDDVQATGAYMHSKYREYLVDLDLRLLPEVHALSSGLKALAAKVSNQSQASRPVKCMNGRVVSSVPTWSRPSHACVWSVHLVCDV